jgi:hypothetical protein
VVVASFIAGLLCWSVLSAILRYRSGGRWLPYLWPQKRAPRAPRVGKLWAMVQSRDVVWAPKWYARLFHLMLWGAWLGTLALLGLRFSQLLQASPLDALALVAIPLGLLLGLPLCQLLGHSLWRVERTAHLLPADDDKADAAAMGAGAGNTELVAAGSRALRGLRTWLWSLAVVVPAAAALVLG